MPLHDWTRVDVGTYHSFQIAWITHLKECLNTGLLPAGYYAMSEQHAGQIIADVLTLHVPDAEAAPRGEGPVAAPKVGHRVRLSPSAYYRAARKTLTIRRERGHRVVALLEIASPGNKDREATVDQFVDKVESALKHGCHVQVVDLLPPGPHDPGGLNGAIWERCGLEEDEDVDAPSAAGKPLTLASYVAGPLPEVYVEHLAVGEELPAMPLFLTPDNHVPLPLGPTYDAAYRGMPGFWRAVVEGLKPAP